MTSRVVPIGRQQRRREILARLVDCGVSRRYQAFHVLGRAAGHGQLIERLATTLAELGPVFAALGRYLASRPDVLPIEDCLRLAVIPDRGFQQSPEQVREILRTELDAAPEELFDRFADEPLLTRLFSQGHRARLADGREVVVWTTGTQRAAAAEQDLVHVPEVLQAFQAAGLLLPQARVGDLVADFRREVRARLDLSAQARDLIALARESRQLETLAVPAVMPRLTTTAVLTLEYLPGRPLEELGDSVGDEPTARREIVAKLGVAWLRQLLGGSIFPVEAEIECLEDGRLAITSGVFYELAAATRLTLWEYLRATARDDPDRACSILVPLMHARRGASEVALRTRMRQAMPFRDGAWSASGTELAEHLVLHWGFARLNRFEPPAEMNAFFRGVFWLARVGRRAAPEVDVAREGLERLQWMVGWSQIRRLFATSEGLGNAVEGGLLRLVELPQKLNHFLDLMAAGEIPVKMAESPGRRRLRRALVTVVVLFVMMLSLSLLVRHPSLNAAAGPWLDKLSAVVFLGLGLLMLKILKDPR